MKKIIFYLVSFIFLSASLVLAQPFPANQDTVVIVGGEANIGSIENTINGDTLAGAVRVNPNRVYVLQANTIYYVQAPIQFGSTKDTTSTLNIIGQTGGNLPIILGVPANGGAMFNDVIDGNFTIKNVYWPARSATNSPNQLFVINGVGKRLIMDNVVTEFAGGDLLTFNQGGGSLYFYNCYFRDMNWFTSSWNSCFVTNNGFDTAWVENCTVTHTGLGFLLINTVKFAYFNHNTFVDAAKYGIAKYQYLKGYFVNNVFVNMNWEGECSGTEYTQNDAHVFKGVTDIDTVEPTLWQAEQGFVPSQDSVKFLTSNNLHFTDTCFNQYYTGGFLTAAERAAGFTQPTSTRTWAPASWVGDSTILKVQNIPPIFLSSMTINLAKKYKNIVIDYKTITDGVDPKLKTPAVQTNGVHTEAALANMVYFSESNYGVAPTGQTYDPSQFTFGDYDPTTIPGPGTENGTGFAQISDLRENFSYSAKITSTIDSKPLGALHWWPNGLSGWDSQAQFKAVEAYYNKLVTGVKLANNTLPAKYSLEQNYPNPFNPSTIINYAIPQSGNVTLKVYNILGQEVASLFEGFQKAGSYTTNFDASKLASGVYFYRLQAGQFNATKKMLYLK
jgi:hypothetical protein